MKAVLFKNIVVVLIAVFASVNLFGQPGFVDMQKANEKIAEVFNRRADSLKKELAAKKINWPIQAIYIRSFKFDRVMEIWVKGEFSNAFSLFKNYKVCAQSGTAGPKRMEGDYQVPEGIYYINEFNPNSNYHLSLGLNYPNASDRILSDPLRPGSEIYIHGSCVSVGCIAIDDPNIEELYVLASHAKAAGQDFIPVHVFPVNYNEKKSLEYLANTAKSNVALQRFAAKLKTVFTYFEENNNLPVITVNKKGEYTVY